MKKVIMCGGVTAGHIFPLLSLAETLKTSVEEFEFVTSSLGFEKSLIPSDLYTIRHINGARSVSRLSLQNLFAFLCVCKGALVEIILALRERPSLVIGTGSFISAPVYIMAVVLGVPFFIIEPNASMGLVNRAFSRFCHTNYFYLLDLPQHPNFKKLGIPIRTIPSTNLAPCFFTKSKEKTVIFIGGGDGSETVNTLVFYLLTNKLLQHYRVIWVTGARHYDKYSSIENNRISVKPYVPNLYDYYSTVDVVVSSAGASTIAEALSFHKILVLVPPPQSTGNHQVLNAEVIHSLEAGFLLQGNLHYQSFQLLDLLKRDLSKLLHSQSIRALSCTNSSSLIANDIVDCLSCGESLPEGYSKYLPWKRLLDLIGIFLLAVPVPILLIVVAVPMKLSRPNWPIIFTQVRVGQQKRLFTIFKLTTLPPDFPEVPTLEINCSSFEFSRFHSWLRRSCINELPQLLNVLIGDMSLVGPRPAILADKRILSYRSESALCNLKPGLTFPDRLQLRDDSMYLQREKLELSYLSEGGMATYLAKDLILLFKTLLFVFNQMIRSRNGKNQEHSIKS